MIPKQRIAIYSRHSDAEGASGSSDNQVNACCALARRLGGEVVGTYCDQEVSGFSLDRPGLLALLMDVRDAKIDIIVSVAVERLSRDGEDLTWLGERMRKRVFGSTRSTKASWPI
jgi:DNA invertase Pin-like site-specific DNA recombinase